MDGGGGGGHVAVPGIPVDGPGLSSGCWTQLVSETYGDETWPAFALRRKVSELRGFSCMSDDLRGWP